MATYGGGQRISTVGTFGPSAGTNGTIVTSDSDGYVEANISLSVSTASAVGGTGGIVVLVAGVQVAVITNPDGNTSWGQGVRVCAGLGQSITWVDFGSLVSSSVSASWIKFRRA